MSEQHSNLWDTARNGGLPVAAGGLDTSARPAVVDRTSWQAELDRLRVREKAHTREGDAIAAARRRLPMVEMAPTIQLLGPHGPVTLLEVFEGRQQLIVYYHMWHTGQPASAQCEGCTFSNNQVRELSYLHSRDVTYATFCEGPSEPELLFAPFEYAPLSSIMRRGIVEVAYWVSKLREHSRPVQVSADEEYGVPYDLIPDPSDLTWFPRQARFQRR